ncbi:MAG: glycosyltransferase, partial [Gammaproteobacteria bacterium]
SLPALARALSVEGRLHWPGFQEDVRPWMGACDIVVHTSTAPEPFGRVIVEAMLLEKPVIASRGGGVEEIVEHGVTGLLVPPGDAGALAGAIREMLDCPKEAARMAARAREKALERFSLEGMIQGIASALKGLC